MVELNTPALDTVFQALTDGTRRAMLRSLAEGDRNIGELAAPFDMSLAAASKHVKVLERAGLVRRIVKGRTHICRLEPAPLAVADEWLRFYEQFWNQRLDALDALLRAEDAATGKPKPKGTPR
ncbi:MULTISPECIES: metalloregulator ArsR/SmtB family transcription factor [unclassified Dyella]|uniref:ArsR/SmtB family transcription factor n=1 Tax=unclassified Dyella TaxID=2634549 RepID=UPI000C838D78|nr:MULTISPECIES: metalloregulator ArsR/SmtB family transcription factor [unclassified Dyella]MDR3448036.1 metalloregulator ArsR/SmtB family transcription factor [Dyella sp.]PMQ05489.1 HTH-type transcriptional regulator [Dyella sp. AD56]